MRCIQKIFSMGLMCLTLIGCAHAVTMSDGTKCDANGFVNREPCYYGGKTDATTITTMSMTNFPKEANYHADPGSLVLGSFGFLMGPPFGWAGAAYIFGFRTFQADKDHPAK